MVARFLAFAIAVCTAATGVLPVSGGARCIAMNRVMRADRDCCPKCEAPPQTSVGTPCCQAIRGVTPTERASSAIHEPQISPAPMLALLAPASQSVAVEATRTALATPRGRPPGEQLQRYSSILRI